MRISKTILCAVHFVQDSLQECENLGLFVPDPKIPFKVTPLSSEELSQLLGHIPAQ